MIPPANSQREDPSLYYVGKDSTKTTPYAIFHEMTHATDDTFDDLMLWHKGFEDKKNKFINKININEQLSRLQKERSDTLSSELFKEYHEKHEKFIEILKNYVNINKDNIRFNTHINLYGAVRKEEETTLNYIQNELNELNSEFFSLQKFWKFFDYNDIIKINSENQQLINDLELYERILRNIDIKIEEAESVLRYSSDDSEIKSRLNHLRIKSKHNLDNEFDINKYPELKNDSQYKDLHETLKLSDEQINELMEYTADNDMPKSTMSYENALYEKEQSILNNTLKKTINDFSNKFNDNRNLNA